MSFFEKSFEMNTVEMNYIYKRPDHSAWLQTIRERDELCDVTIKVRNKQIRAHKLVLAATIDYFHRMFLGNSEERMKDVISIDDFDEEIMEAIVTFSYTGKIVFTKENAADMLKATHFFELTDVKYKCIKFLKYNLETKNVFAMLHLAKLVPGCTSLLERTEKFIRRNLREVSLTDSYRNVDIELLKSILSREVPPIYNSEIIFEAIMRWISTDVDSKMTHLSELLRHVSLLDLSSQFLIGFLFKDEFKNSIGPKHREIVAEVLSVFNELKQINDSKNTTAVIRIVSRSIATKRQKNKLKIFFRLFIVGTSLVKFSSIVLLNTDIQIRNKTAYRISTRLHSITAMREYKSKSFEELRFEDYNAGRNKGCKDVARCPYFDLNLKK
ncbi:hypothetical protein TSAR_008304 [Trichomalopsis sarcophagae]|uniref:Nuclear pore complex protein Nup98-Nup96 n=1 Tax=Trichomalopsis sarcophagae TaxID=543379 RepID=A0A232FDA0_9HYME|nr:hypothetical protein TSAR_008304 [Trichomalopsis sarcophagae]